MTRRPKLETIRKRKAEAVRAMEELDRQEKLIEAERRIEDDPVWKKALSNHRQVKHELQVVRVNIARKGYSVMSKQKAINRIKESIRDFEKKEKTLVTALEKAVKNLEVVRAKLKRNLSMKT